MPEHDYFICEEEAVFDIKHIDMMQYTNNHHMNVASLLSYKFLAVLKISTALLASVQQKSTWPSHDLKFFFFTTHFYKTEWIVHKRISMPTFIIVQQISILRMSSCLAIIWSYMTHCLMENYGKKLPTGSFVRIYGKQRSLPHEIVST